MKNMTERNQERADNYLNSIPVENWTIQKIPATVKSAYLEGCDVVDQDYREAIFEYCKANGVEFCKVFPQILKFLSK